MFPKVIGGFNDATFINVIDVYNDDLVVAGDCYDSKITYSNSNPPLIGVIEMSKPGT